MLVLLVGCYELVCEGWVVFVMDVVEVIDLVGCIGEDVVGLVFW